jgi:hypothetical protein
LPRSLAARLGITSVPRDELRGRYALSGSKFVTNMGADVHYVDEGHGAAIVMIEFFHGEGTRAAIGTMVPTPDFSEVDTDVAEDARCAHAGAMGCQGSLESRPRTRPSLRAAFGARSR